MLDDTVTAMKIDGVEATEENIVAGKYLLSRPFVMATKGKIDEQNDIVKAWFDYVNSDEGQAVIKEGRSYPPSVEIIGHINDTKYRPR